MKQLIVEAASKRYPIWIDQSFDGLARAVGEARLHGRRACIVTDSNVAPLYEKAVREALDGLFPALSCFRFTAGEDSKNLSTLQDMYACFLKEGLDRSSLVIALGGGVTGDMAGFGAATYMRGIPFIQIPTTLLSQVDSSVGGKTGVDFMGAKNAIGAFYQPELVYMNIHTLDTLPRAEVSSGLGEVVKHGLLADADYYAYLAGHLPDIAALDPEVMMEIVHGSCRIKAHVVAQDEREQGLRETLNLGHTFGHAIESLYDFQLPHGHCVGLGLCAALALSAHKGYITPQEQAEATALIHALGLPVTLPNDSVYERQRAKELMLMDKKTRNGQIKLVLLERIGQAFSYANASEDEIDLGFRAIESVER